MSSVRVNITANPLGGRIYRNVGGRYMLSDPKWCTGPSSPALVGEVSNCINKVLRPKKPKRLRWTPKGLGVTGSIKNSSNFR